MVHVYDVNSYSSGVPGNRCNNVPSLCAHSTDFVSRKQFYRNTFISLLLSRSFVLNRYYPDLVATAIPKCPHMREQIGT